MHRECDRYALDRESVAAVVAGNDPLADNQASAAVVGDSDCHGCERRFCVAGSGDARAAHFREHSLDDCADHWHDDSAGAVRNAAVETDEILVGAVPVRARTPARQPARRRRYRSDSHKCGELACADAHVGELAGWRVPWDADSSGEPSLPSAFDRFGELACARHKLATLARGEAVKQRLCI